MLLGNPSMSVSFLPFMRLRATHREIMKHLSALQRAVKAEPRGEQKDALDVRRCSDVTADTADE